MGNNQICTAENPFNCDNVGSYVDEKINSSRILMVSKTACPACRKAKRLFNQIFPELGESPFVVELDQYSKEISSQIIRHLTSISGSRTVPQIFFNGTFVGGNDTCQDLRAKRQLVSLYNSSRKRRASLASQIPTSPVPTQNFNYITVSPMMTLPKRRIVTQAVDLSAQDIKDYMATEFSLSTTMSDLSLESMSTMHTSSMVDTSRTYAEDVKESEDFFSSNNTRSWRPRAKSTPIPLTAVYDTRVYPLPAGNSNTNSADPEYDVVTTYTTDDDGEEVEEVEFRPRPRRSRSLHREIQTYNHDEDINPNYNNTLQEVEEVQSFNISINQYDAQVI